MRATSSKTNSRIATRSLTQGELFEDTTDSPCCEGRRAVVLAPYVAHGCEQVRWRCDCGGAGLWSRRIEPIERIEAPARRRARG